jgi:hypothetical protein
MKPFVQQGDRVVDFSCGSNEWANMVEEELGCDFVSFDLFPPKMPKNWFHMDWFDVKVGLLPSSPSPKLEASLRSLVSSGLGFVASLKPRSQTEI